MRRRRSALASAIYTLLIVAPPSLYSENIDIEVHSTSIANQITQIADSARQAAEQQQNARASKIFNRLLHEAPEAREQFLKEYADQLVSAKKPEKAIPLYYELLAANPPAATASQIKKDLAGALNLAGYHCDSLSLHDALLAETPLDTSLQQERANLLIAMAQQSAKYHQHSAAAEKYEELIASAPSYRESLLPSYAEQLTLAGRHAEAAPYYYEIISLNPTSPEATQARQNLNLAPPPSANLSSARQSMERQAMVLVALARQSAAEKRHAEAVSFFEEAFQYDHSCRSEILLEYANQLVFSDNTKQAIPLFYEILAFHATLDNVNPTRKSLGFALHKEGQLDEALRIYESLAVVTPDDAELTQALVNTLSALARRAAIENEHKTAGEFFARAAALSPDARGSFLKEWADQLAYAGELSPAIELYREGLATENASACQIALAQTLFWNGQNEEALTYYYQILSQDPTHTSAKHGFANVISAIARDTFSKGDKEEGASLMLKALTTDPRRRPELASELADMYVELNKPFEAIPLYHEALIGTTNAPATDKIKQGLDKAQQQMLAYVEKVQQYRNSPEYLLVYDDDGELVSVDHRSTTEIAEKKRMPIEEIFAQAEAYLDSGDFTKAIALYEQTLDNDLTQSERKLLQIELASTLYQKGMLLDAIEQYQAVLDEEPNEPQARQNLADIYAEQGKKAASAGETDMAVALLEKAIAKDIIRRPEILQFLADQYLLNDNPAEAIPLYYEVLASATSNDYQRKATQGLSKALVLQEKRVSEKKGAHKPG